MEKYMLKKMMLSTVAASVILGGSYLPCFAEGDTFENICLFPVRLVGSTVGTIVGVPEGAVKDGVRGAIKSTKLVAGKLGNEDGKYQPTAAADGFLGGVGSLLGSTTAGIFDVPEGILVNSLYRMPLKTTKALAERFGDEKGFYQNVIGATIGIPTGFVFGIPYGAITGAKHGLTSGWEKPFSTESYLVKDEE